MIFGEQEIKDRGITAHLELAKEASGALLKGDMVCAGPSRVDNELLTAEERSGLLALHRLLRELDPTHQTLGLTRFPTYTGDFLWLCKTHYEQSQSKFPDRID